MRTGNDEREMGYTGENSADHAATPAGDGLPLADRLRIGDQLCFALYAATNAVTRAYRPLLAEIDLTYPQYLVMMALWQDGPCASRAIAERLQLPANAVSPLIDRLETAGLVERRRTGGDRRVVPVHLTEKGAALEAAAASAQGAVVCRTGLDPQALAALRRELHALTARLSPEGHGPRADAKENHRARGSADATATTAGVRAAGH